MGLEQAIDRTPVEERPRIDTEAQALVGSRCRECDTAVWPARAVCHRCGSPDVADARFARTGALRSMTRVLVARPDQQVPYLLGQVWLDGDGPEIFGRVVGVPIDIELPTPVTVAVGPGAEGGATYWFTPPADD